MNDLKKRLEHIYSRYNKKEYVNPDPLLFLYNYPETANREIAGFISACLAYGRVEQIMKNVAYVLERLGPSPLEYICGRTKKDMSNDFKGFKYRFAKAEHMVGLLWGIKTIIEKFGSIENCFNKGMAKGDNTLLPGLVFLYNRINEKGALGHLLADPEKKSACKRSHLFLRWMVRKDDVDPGGWKRSDPSRLIVPLDTHMHKIGIMLGFTRRKSADIKTALEITQGFRKISKQDPIKYDFSLTRFGIRKSMDIRDLKIFVSR